MDFSELAQKRYSVRKYDSSRPVEEEKLQRLLEVGALAPSACNGQPYMITVLRGDQARRASKYVMGMGMNKFAADAPVLLVISERPYCKTAALGAKIKNNDYRSMDIGILASYITLEAAELGLGSCILGWLDDRELRKVCDLSEPVRLVITLGYSVEEEIPDKKRKNIDELVKYI